MIIKRSEPYVITITSTCSKDVQNITIGDANNPLNTFDANGDLILFTPTSVVVSLDSTVASYADFLNRMRATPMRVGKVMIVSVVGANNQVETVYEIIHYVANEEVGKLIAPTIPPDQEQSNRVIVDYDFLFDGNTKITIAQLLAHAVIRIYIYPMAEYDPSRLVEGRNSLLEYTPPRIERTARVFLKIQ
jgi:hypothetical protein